VFFPGVAHCDVSHTVRLIHPAKLVGSPKFEDDPMRKIIMLGGMLLVAAGVSTVAFRVPKSVVAQQHAAPAEPINPGILSKHLHDMRGEMASP
jgi:hypothetical protein